MDIIKDRLNYILSKLPFKERDILFCGGVVRYITGEQDTFRDIDIIVKDDSAIYFYGVKKPPVVNLYGGTKVITDDGIEIDVWSLGHHIIPCKSFEEVENTWLLSCDAIYYNVEEDKLYCKNYNKHPLVNWSRHISDIEKDYINTKLQKFVFEVQDQYVF